MATTRRKKTKQLPDVNDALMQIHRDCLCTASRELWLHSTHAGDEEPGVEYRMASMFLKNLNVLEKDSAAPILIHMHAIGGEWNDGMAIFDAIRLSPCDTVMIAYAQASSMTGIILQAPKVRLMMPSCEFMAHTGTLDVKNESRTAMTMAQRNMACHERMLDIFAERCITAPRHKNLTHAEMRNKIDQWMKDQGEINILAQEAVDNGFADGVLGSKEFPSILEVWSAIFR